MGSFPTWAEWIELKEDNARKRAVRDAMKGTKPPLPGSYAACPRTDPRAMDVAKKTGVVGKNTKFKFREDNEVKPDYSFDRWIQKAKEFGDDVNKLVGHAEDDEEKLDKDAEEKKKKADEEDAKAEKQKEPDDSKSNQESDDPESKKKKDETWKQLQQIHKGHLKSPPSDIKNDQSSWKVSSRSSK